MILGHAKKGMGRIYDEHRYEDEMRAAYEQWAGLLRGLITPTPVTDEEADNVVTLPRRSQA